MLGQIIAHWLKTRNADLVAPQHSCPHCGERNPDQLVWQPDESIVCAVCGKRYAI